MGSEIIFMVPYVVAFAAVATIVGTLVIWLVWTGLRRWGPRLMRETSTAFPMGIVLSVLLCISIPVGCALVEQPVYRSVPMVAAFEVRLPTANERTEFLTIVGREAAAEGLNIDARTDADLERDVEGGAGVAGVAGVAASIWRGGRANDRLEAYIWRMDSERLWISFSRGEDPALAQRFRARVMRQVLARWPGALGIPVAATGALPLKQDLVLGKEGYEIDPAKLAGYTCDAALGPEAAPPEVCR